MVRATVDSLVSARIARRILARCSDQGCDTYRLCALVGLAPEGLDDPDARLPSSTIRELAEYACAFATEEDFGLRLALDQELQRRDHFSLQLLMMSPNLATAFVYFTALLDPWEDGHRVEVMETNEELVVRSTSSGTGRHAAECTLAEVMLYAEALLGRRLAPRAVRFRHPRPSRVELHRSLFCAEPAFGASHDELVIPRAAAEESLAEARARLLERMNAQPEGEPPLSIRTSGTVVDVRVAARAALARGGPSLSDVARILRTSPRTLQRRLQEEGTSFLEVIELLRFDMARAYLKQGTSVAQIAALLGYGDPASLVEATRRHALLSPLAPLHPQRD